ncbi:MAG: hypothetical protein LBB34_01250, partial [Holosporales bacterium]|nr:hypothetical protein [Holosporales bacterium]
MGILVGRQKGLCTICGEKAGWGKIKTADGKPVCKQCFKCWSVDIPDIKERLEQMNSENARKLLAFCENGHELFLQLDPSRSVANFLNIDENHRLWSIQSNGRYDNIIAYSYSDILKFEVIKDNIVVTSGTSGGALVGALLGGVAG